MVTTMKRGYLKGTESEAVSSQQDMPETPTLIAARGETQGEKYPPQRSVRRDKFSRELVADAQELFQRRLGRPVSEGEARNLLGDLTDFYWLIIGWELARAHVSAKTGESDPTEQFPLETT